MKLILFFLVLCLGGCATQNPHSGINNHQFEAAATAPLNDLNLIRSEIPMTLTRVQSAPYALTDAPTCTQLINEVNELNKLLGPDIDQNPINNDQTLLDDSSHAIGQAAIDAVRRTTEGMIPFRSWLRKLTGAEQASKAHSHAFKAGSHRRAFLKGVMKGIPCENSIPSSIISPLDSHHSQPTETEPTLSPSQTSQGLH